MDHGPVDNKRPRLASWSGATSQPTSLPHPHQHPLPHSHSASQLPPPAHPQLPAVAPYHQPYPPRHPDIAPVHSAPAPPHGLPIQHPDVERRHQDQEPLAPMQDHYRHQHLPQQQQQQQQQHHQHPPQSPAQQHYSYPPRESLVKREGQDDSRRPTSTGHLQEGGNGPIGQTHQGLPSTHPTPSYPPETQRHVSYDNGQQAPSTPGAYRPHPAPPTPLSQQPPYDMSNHYQVPDSLQNAYSSSQSKKKNTRASQACDQCRQLKAKCDETKPCKTCRDKGTECRYRDPVPKATDKAQSDILEGISMMQSTLVALTDHFKVMDERLTFIEKSVGPRPDGIVAKAEALGESRNYKSAGSPDAVDDNGAYGAQDLGGHDTIPEDEVEREPGPPVPPGEPAIPINHTTLAGLLLNWPSIRELTKSHVERAGIHYVGEYPISQEQNRGLLILYGRGEDSHSARQQREPLDHGNLEMGDDSSDIASPSPAADWGYLGGMSPHDQFEYRGGVLGVDGNPDFTEAKVWSYVESFKEHILNMHPILQPHIITEWVRHFLDTLPTAQARQAKSSKTFAVGGSTPAVPEGTGAKRKRSPAPDTTETSAMSPPAKSGKPNRTIHTALVLTILALGKVCQHRESIPEALHHSDAGQHGSPLVRNGIPGSPKQGSPPAFSSRSASSGLPSPREQDKSLQSRRSSTQGGGRPGPSMKKNYEVIPGLEYFAFATDILGNHTGSYNNMKNVYANIFAGLYHGQLARPLESFAFIHQAGHKLQVAMRPSLDKLRKIKRNAEFIQETKYNQLALAFWTCLQLESDLIAELPVPPSGLLSYENDMPHPNMSLLQGFSKPILDSYLGQLYLRTHLNSIHRMFYSPDDDHSESHGETSKYKNVDVVADAVSNMQWVGPSFAFNEDDPPAGDILSARLRAKYWGAQNITFRPFLRQILHFSAAKSHPAEIAPPVSEFRAEINVPRIDPENTDPANLDPKIFEFAKKGIRALIESTRSFHGLGDKRPIITNVFGTAHAQWGNLLVLAAVYKDPILHGYIDEELLRGLFQKTIAFLRQSATSTSSLKYDMEILEGLQRDLFGVTEAKLNNSFTSNSNSQTPKPGPGTTAMLPPGSSEGDGTPYMPSSVPPPST